MSRTDHSRTPDIERRYRKARERMEYLEKALARADARGDRLEVERDCLAAWFHVHKQIIRNAGLDLPEELSKIIRIEAKP